MHYTHDEVDLLSRIFKKRLRHERQTIDKLNLIEARLRTQRPLDAATLAEQQAEINEVLQDILLSLN